MEGLLYRSCDSYAAFYSLLFHLILLLVLFCVLFYAKSFLDISVNVPCLLFPFRKEIKGNRENIKAVYDLIKSNFNIESCQKHLIHQLWHGAFRAASSNFSKSSDMCNIEGRYSMSSPSIVSEKVYGGSSSLASNS